MTALLLSLVLLVGNALFVASEFALIAARATKIEPMTATSWRARWALRAMNDIPLMIAGAQLGITVCSLGLGAIAEPALAHLLEAPFDALGLPEAARHPVAFVLALGLVVFAHTVIGEMVPKNLTLADPLRTVLWLGPPMLAFCRTTRPLLLALKWAAKQVLRIWDVEAVDAVKSVYTADELANLVSQARAEGLLEPEDHARISGALALLRRTAGDVVRPLSKVTTVPEDISPASLEVLAGLTGRSRFPVFERASPWPLGFVHVKDVIGVTGAARNRAIDRSLVRPFATVPADRKLADLLVAMQRERQHIVLVSDGGRAPVGVLTLHDVLGVIQALPAGPRHRIGL